jgi:hypothetical protein
MTIKIWRTETAVIVSRTAEGLRIVGTDADPTALTLKAWSWRRVSFTLTSPLCIGQFTGNRSVHCQSDGERVAASLAYPMEVYGPSTSASGD